MNDAPDMPAPLPDSVTLVSLPGREIYLVGTAHVSAKSVREVRSVIGAVSPEAVAVELCEPRLRAMRGAASWKQTDIFQVVRQKKTAFLLAQLALQAFYRRIGKSLEVEPGAEMKAAIDAADAARLPLVPVDRRIDVTLKRIWRSLSFFAKVRLFCSLASSLFSSDEKAPSAEEVENLKNRDAFSSMLAEMDAAYPGIKSRLIDERDIYLARRIRDIPHARIVAVVGAGHVPGILRAIREEHDLAPLDILPPKSLLSRILPWVLPLAVLALLVYGFFAGGRATGVDSLLIWTLVNVGFTAVGASLVLAHPLAILAGALAAPITSLNPFIAAGWVAGLVQAWVRPPTVADFESLPAALESARAFFFHPLVRVLLVVVAANLGSSVGTFVAIPWIVAHFGGTP